MHANHHMKWTSIREIIECAAARPPRRSRMNFEFGNKRANSFENSTACASLVQSTRSCKAGANSSNTNAGTALSINDCVIPPSVRRFLLNSLDKKADCSFISWEIRSVSCPQWIWTASIMCCKVGYPLSSNPLIHRNSRFLSCENPIGCLFFCELEWTKSPIEYVLP